MFFDDFVPFSLKSWGLFFFVVLFFVGLWGLWFGFGLFGFFFLQQDVYAAVSANFKLPSSVTVTYRNSSSMELSMVGIDPVSLLAN